MSISSMTSSVPYLLRSINDWILDNGYTPYLIVDAQYPDVRVPADSVKDGQIVLNISPSAIRNLVISNEYVMFSGRFGGVPFEIAVPIKAVLGIVAKENGEGMWFSREEAVGESKEGTDAAEGVKGVKELKGPPNLKIIKASLDNSLSD